ncbi:hypothetical protein [Diplodia seriata ambiguivirus 1]|nr:hypothetical protein [Diplodia seriata ambiguivirus 1]
MDTHYTATMNTLSVWVPPPPPPPVFPPELLEALFAFLSVFLTPFFVMALNFALVPVNLVFAPVETLLFAFYHEFERQQLLYKLVGDVLGALPFAVPHHFVFGIVIPWLVATQCRLWQAFAWRWWRMAAGVWVLFLRHTHLGWLLELVVAWTFFRGARAPPAVVEQGNVSDPSLPNLAVAHAVGARFAQDNRLRHADLAAGGLQTARLRRRARWVRSLEQYLGSRPGVVGRLVRGRWTPDLPSSDLSPCTSGLLNLLDCEVKLLGGGVVPSTNPAINEPFLVVQTAEGREVIAPNLLGRLTRGTLGRERTDVLMAQLRSRAVEWCKSQDVVEWAQPLLVPPAVARAMVPTAPEVAALSAMRAAGAPVPTTQSL